MSSSFSDDQMQLLNHYYPELQPPPAAAAAGSEVKPRRRRKNNLGESSNIGFKKRKLSGHQVNMLELHFETEHKLDSERKHLLASQLGLHPRQVAVWFQNRRARWKTKKLEEEYSRLKTEHESTVSEKCLLQTQVSKLKEQLSEAKTGRQELVIEQSNRASCNSPSSSFSAGVTEPPFLGEFGMKGLESVFCVTENNYDAHGMVYWPDLYDM